MKWDSELEKKLRYFVNTGLEDKQIALRMNTTKESIVQRRRKLLLFKNKTALSKLGSRGRKERMLDQDKKHRKDYRARNITRLRRKETEQSRTKRTLAVKDFNSGNRMTYWRKKISDIKSKKRFKVSIVASDLEQQWIKQEGKCFYTKIDLNVEIPGGGRKNTQTLLSVDRINPKLGYEKDNIAIVSFDVNTMKRQYTHVQFVEICKKIAENF